MRKVYVAHPYNGITGSSFEIKRNMISIDLICREISKAYNDVIIISPIHALSFYDTLDDPKMIIGKCLQLLNLCDELWVFGDFNNSAGCLKEIEFAANNNIPISYKELKPILNDYNPE